MIKISPAKSAILLAVGASLMLGGCETLNKLNPFGGGDGLTKDQKKKEAAKKYDNRPVYEPTGNIPADTANAKRSGEDLKAGK
jgi:hypothetical protein